MVLYTVSSNTGPLGLLEYTIYTPFLFYYRSGYRLGRLSKIG